MTSIRSSFLLSILLVIPIYADATSVAGPETATVVVRDTVRLPPDLTRADSIAVATLDQRNTELHWQRYYWFATGVVVLTGFFFAWRRIRTTESANAREHYDELIATYLGRFAGKDETKSVRVGALIGLTNLTNVKDPLHRNPFKGAGYPYRRDIVSLFVKSLAVEDDPDVRGTIVEQVVEIGGPALQRLVDRHRKWFPVLDIGYYQNRPIEELPPWFPVKEREPVSEYDLKREVDLDRLPPHFTASRDAIAGIIRTAREGDLASPWLIASGIPFYLRRPKTWRARWQGRRRLKRVPWLDEWSLSYLALMGADLTSARLHHAYLFRAQLQYADLRYAQLHHTNLQIADFHEAVSWEEATYGGSNWPEADLTDEQKEWFEEHYPWSEHEAEFLKYWRRDEVGFWEPRSGSDEPTEDDV